MEILLALFITLAIEVNIYMVIDRKNIFLWLWTTLMNVVLNVSMNLLLSLNNTLFWYWFTLILFEIMTTAIEGLLIHVILKYQLIKCWIVAIIANASSFLVGLLINQFDLNATTKIVLLIVFIIIYAIGLGFTTYQYAKKTNS